MNLLFQPIKFRSLTLKNKIVLSPMCQYSSEDGFANDWHLVHLGSRAVGGAGLIITEATAVSPEGRISPGDLGIWKDEHIGQLSRITKFIHDNGALSAIQLAHAGRKASHQSPWDGNNAISQESGGWQTFAPSPIPYKSTEPLPLEMSAGDITKVINDFKTATVRSLKAGFKIIEIHAAHGYLINEFLSPLSNQRKDNYGGSFENRTRILIEIVDTVRSEWPDDLPIFVRISATDWVEGGWNKNDSVQLAKILKEKQIDLIDCSTGGNSPLQKIATGPLYQVAYADKIKNEANIPTGAVGMITTPEEAEQILIQGKADLIIIARQFLRDPYFPINAAKKLGVDIKRPKQYERAI